MDLQWGGVGGGLTWNVLNQWLPPHALEALVEQGVDLHAHQSSPCSPWNGASTLEEWLDRYEHDLQNGKVDGAAETEKGLALVHRIRVLDAQRRENKLNDSWAQDSLSLDKDIAIKESISSSRFRF